MARRLFREQEIGCPIHPSSTMMPERTRMSDLPVEQVMRVQLPSGIPTVFAARQDERSFPKRKAARSTRAEDTTDRKLNGRAVGI